MTEEELKRGLDDAYKKAGHNAFFSNGFMAGVEFMKGHLDKAEKESVAKEVLNDFNKYLNGLDGFLDYTNSIESFLKQKP